ncbi:BamA/TamA family outer membrane protein [Ekhidna sp.]
MQRILILLVFMLAFSAKAQINAEIFEDGDPYDARVFSDSLQLSEFVTDLQLSWINKGYFFSGVDSINVSSQTIRIYLHKGDMMNARFEGFKGKNLDKHLQRELSSYANRGYPFASFELDSLKFLNKNTLAGKIRITSGPEIIYDSAFFFTKPKTSTSYIYQLLDMVPGDLFSEKNHKEISRKIERSPFLLINRPPDLSFKKNRAITFLDIKEEASSTFQGVVGLQQGSEGRTTAVGSVELDIQNLFRSGKQFKFSWESFSESSQELNVYYKHPFFLDSKLSPSFRFELLKQDTTFLTRLVGIGIHTFISPRTQLFLEYERTGGTLLSTDIELLSISGLADFTRTNYLIQFSRGVFSSLGKFKKAMAWNISSAVGRKSIDRNLNLPDSYYDTIQFQTNAYRLEGHIAYQLPVLKRQAFFHSVRVGVLENDELLRNELYRIGGLRSLRGFNEKSIFAEQFLLSRFEFRSFFENNSYAYVLYDQLVYSGSLSDQPFGVGLGFALATSSGQFSFALAVGKSIDQAISFSTMKAHFGYVAKF